VAQFALSGLAIVVLLGLAGVELLRHAGNDEALRDAKNNTRIAARGVAEPNLTPAVVRGNPAALARFDRIMRASVIQPPIVRVKIWSPDGRIVYSDEPRLIGARYPLDAADRAVLRSGGGGRRRERPVAPREPLRARAGKAGRGLPRREEHGRPAAHLRGL
jgi:hypothetical protein